MLSLKDMPIITDEQKLRFRTAALEIEQQRDELLEAMKLIEQWADSGRHEEDFDAIGNKARAAIAKAESGKC